MNGARRRLQELADEELMGRAAQGDERAFGVVFERHGAVAFSLAYRMCGSAGRAEEVVQEAFLSVWRSTTGYDPSRGSVRTWILGVVHNRAVDLLRRETIRAARNATDEFIGETIASSERTEAEVERRDEARRVHTALCGLPGDQRRVIELAYFGGFSHTEIAEILALPQGTVKGRMRLGMMKLRTELAGAGGIP